MSKVADRLWFLAFILFVIFFLQVLARTVWGQEESRVYHPFTIMQITNEDPARWRHLHTHVRVEGYATYKKHEADDDKHIRVCSAADVAGMDKMECIVAECIPELPCTEPKVGQKVRVQGIVRYDAEHGHGWWEVHPVEKLEVLP